MKAWKGILIIISIIIIFGVVGVCTGWFNTWFGNEVEYVDKKIDDATSYDTRKKVEDTCRAMISSYTSDTLAYEQYKESDDKEQQSWAEQAKMRANKTASSYNNYILSNSFVWSGNVPSDISSKLEYID